MSVVPELSGSTVTVVGGAGFIGSHIVDQLLDEPVERIIVLDNFVRGTHDNLERASRDARVEVREGSILDLPFLEKAMEAITSSTSRLFGYRRVSISHATR